MIKNGCIHISQPVYPVGFYKVISSISSRGIFMENIEFQVNEIKITLVFVRIKKCESFMQMTGRCNLWLAWRFILQSGQQTVLNEKSEFVFKLQIVSLNMVSSKELANVFDHGSDNLSIRKLQHLNSAGEIVNCHNRFGKQFGIINLKMLTPCNPAASLLGREWESSYAYTSGCTYKSACNSCVYNNKTLSTDTRKSKQISIALSPHLLSSVGPETLSKTMHDETSFTLS